MIGYSRTLGDETIIIVVNNSSDKKSVVTTIPAAAKDKNTFVNLLDGRKIVNENNKFTVELKPYEIMILQ